MSSFYIETSIPSFYFEIRSEPAMIARREWTRQWWMQLTPRDLVVTSPAVLDELRRGQFHSKSETLGLISELPLLQINSAVEEIVEAYIAHKLMPADPFGDALHLALASYHRCDFLVTWNCSHLANAKKYGHIRRVNAILGLQNPTLVTPLELLGEESLS